MEPRSPNDWSVSDVQRYIGSLGLEELQERFGEHEVTGAVLLSLTEADLEQGLDIQKFGLRRRLALGIQELKESALSTHIPSNWMPYGSDHATTCCSHPPREVSPAAIRPLAPLTAPAHPASYVAIPATVGIPSPTNAYVVNASKVFPSTPSRSATPVRACRTPSGAHGFPSFRVAHAPGHPVGVEAATIVMSQELPRHPGQIRALSSERAKLVAPGQQSAAEAMLSPRRKASLQAVHSVEETSAAGVGGAACSVASRLPGAASVPMPVPRRPSTEVSLPVPHSVQDGFPATSPQTLPATFTPAGPSCLASSVSSSSKVIDAQFEDCPPDGGRDLAASLDRATDGFATKSDESTFPVGLGANPVHIPGSQKQADLETSIKTSPDSGQTTTLRGGTGGDLVEQAQATVQRELWADVSQPVNEAYSHERSLHGSAATASTRAPAAVRAGPNSVWSVDEEVVPSDAGGLRRRPSPRRKDPGATGPSQAVANGGAANTGAFRRNRTPTGGRQSPTRCRQAVSQSPNKAPSVTPSSHANPGTSLAANGVQPNCHVSPCSGGASEPISAESLEVQEGPPQERNSVSELMPTEPCASQHRSARSWILSRAWAQGRSITVPSGSQAREAVQLRLLARDVDTQILSVAAAASADGDTSSSNARSLFVRPYVSLLQRDVLEDLNARASAGKHPPRDLARTQEAVRACVSRLQDALLERLAANVEEVSGGKLRRRSPSPTSGASTGPIIGASTEMDAGPGSNRTQASQQRRQGGREARISPRSPATLPQSRLNTPRRR